MRALLLVLLAATAYADPPFYPRGTATNQALGGINQNFLDQTTLNHNRLTQTITPPSCPAGYALTGAFYNNGYTFGGVCTNTSILASDNVFTGTNTFSGQVVLSTWVALNTATPASVSSGVIGYWDLNISSRTIQAYEVVQASNNVSGGFTYGQAAATTTILGVLQVTTSSGTWGFIGTMGFSKVINSAASCPRNRLVQAAAASPGQGQAQCAAAPAAGSVLGRMVDQCAASATCWMFLRL